MRLLLLPLAFLPLLLPAQAITGHWKGELKADAISLRTALHIDSAGTSAKFDILDQGMKGLPAQDFRIQDSTLHFAIQGATYDGRLHPDGTLRGHLDQGTQKMPMDFSPGEWVINRPQQPKPPFPYHAEDVQFPNPEAPGVTLAGTLTLPATPGPWPAVVLVSGSGPSDRNEDILGHQPFAVVADHLTRHGIAVLRYDDRGVKASTGKHALATSADFASDAIAAIQYLRQRSDLQLSSTGIAGHSEGGLIAPIAATRSKLIDFIILLAGPGVRGDALLAEQVALVMRSAGSSDEEIARTVSEVKPLYKIIIDSKSIKQARPKLEKTLRQQAAARDTTYSDAFIHTTIAQLNNVWMRYFIQCDPAPILRKVTCPVLAINGEKDLQVSATQNLPAIEAALKAGGNTDHSIRSLPGLNHLFQRCDKCDIAEYARLEETFAPEALALVTDWILARARRP